MKTTPNAFRLTLEGKTAADLMTPNPISISESASIREALALLTDRGFSAAPVIDDAGRPVGVVSRADIVVHDRETVAHVPTGSAYYETNEANLSRGEHVPAGFQIEDVDRTQVSDIMTPAVFSVTPQTPVHKVVADMLDLKVHRLFVLSKDGVLVGVISALDVLRHLRLD